MIAGVVASQLLGAEAAPGDEVAVVAASLAFSGSSITDSDVAGDVPVVAAALAFAGSAITELDGIAVSVVSLSFSGSTITDSDAAFATLDGATADTTMSNGNRTATHNNTNSNSGSRSTAQKNSGKYYFEVAGTSITGTFSCVGVMTTGATFTNVVTTGSNCCVTYHGTGAIWSNNASAGVGIPWTTSSNLVCMAFDFDNELAWFRSGAAGNWNGSGTANPATATGGVSISSFSATTMAPMVGFGGAGPTSSETFTANFGQSAFTGTVPSGFTAGWIA